MMQVELAKLLVIANPLINPPWKEVGQPLTLSEVITVSPQPILTDYQAYRPETREQHLQRVAFLIQHGWTQPIVLIMRAGVYPIWDGNHRVIAALFRGEEFISAQVEGSLDLIRKLY